MIEPFELEKNRTDATLGVGEVTDGNLDTSILDRPLKRLNNFDPTDPFERYLREQEPYTRAHQDRVGRVPGRNDHKSDFQGEEQIGERGTLVSEYDMVEGGGGGRRENASVLIHNYLDSEVGYVPSMMETIHPITNLKVDEPVLEPGITFIDSRKNMATRF